MSFILINYCWYIKFVMSILDSENSLKRLIGSNNISILIYTNEYIIIDPRDKQQINNKKIESFIKKHIIQRNHNQKLNIIIYATNKYDDSFEKSIKDYLDST